MNRSRIKPTKNSDFIRETLWPIIKSMQWSAFSGLLGEAEAAYSLEQTGRPFIRCIEEAGADMVLIVDASHAPEELPSRDRGHLERIMWALRTKGLVLCISIDMKYISIRKKLASKQRPFTYSIAKSPWRLQSSAKAVSSELIMTVFEGEPDYVAWLPRTVYLRATDRNYGSEPLQTSVPSWCFPFMVHRDDLAAATDELLAVIEDPGHTFINPTTGVLMHDWLPRATRYPPVVPEDTASNFMSGFNKMQFIWEQLRRVGCQVHFNPIQPLICDFILEVVDENGTKWSLRVEFKSAESLGKPPFREASQWHILMMYNPHKDKLVCIPRHAVLPEWAPLVHLEERVSLNFTYSGDSKFEKMVHDIRTKWAAKAVAYSKQVLQNQMNTNALRGEGGDDPEAPDSESSDDQVSSDDQDETSEKSDSNLGDFSDPEAEVTSSTPGSSFRSPNNEGVPWLCHWLNTLCMHGRSMVCFALDAGHPIGSHILAEYEWSEEDAAHFHETGQTPVKVYSRKLCKARCIPLRFWNMGGTEKDGVPNEPQHPCCMRRDHTVRLATSQPFFILGAVETAQLASQTMMSLSLLLLPSQLTIFPRQALRPPVTDDSRVDRYFPLSQAERRKDLMNIDVFKAAARITLGKDSPVLEKNVNPARYIVDGTSVGASSLYSNLQNILHNACKTSIQAVSGVWENQPFQTDAYHMRVVDVHQAAWDHGLYRPNVGQYASMRGRCGPNVGQKKTDELKDKTRSLTLED